LTVFKTGTYTDLMVRYSRAACIACFFMAAGALVGAQAVRRTVYVSVTDKSGNAVLDVAPSAFVVRENKVAREVLEVALADEPLQIALLVDNSQASEPHIRDYREALSAFITVVTSDNPSPANGKHQIAIISLADRPTILRDYTSDQVQLLKSAQSIFAMPGSGAYLLDGIMETSHGVVKRTTARPVFVAIFPDASSETSYRTYDAVLDALKRSGASLHVVKIGGSMNTSRDRSIVLDEGTRTTGGRYEDLLVSSALTVRLKQIATDLTHQYRVTYARPQSLRPPEKFEVSVTKPGLTVRGTAAREERPQAAR